MSHLTPAAAETLLQERIFVPVYFEKLANDFGLRPESPEQAERMLRIGMKLLEARQQEQHKSASARGDFLGQAEDALDVTLAHYGYGTSSAPSQDQQAQAVKSASVQLAQDPQIREAVLVYHDALARQMEAAAG